MQSHFAHLDRNHHAAYEPRVSNKGLLKSLAESALKEIPGSQRVIDQAFNVGPINDPHRILPTKPMNKALHGPYA